MVERLEGEFRRLTFLANDRVEALVGPDWRTYVWDARQPQHQSLQCGFFRCQLTFEHRRARTGLLRLQAKLGLLFGRRILEPRADGVALGSKRFDLGLGAAHLRIERQKLAKIEPDALVADRPLDRLPVRPDEVEAQHRRQL